MIKSLTLITALAMIGIGVGAQIAVQITAIIKDVVSIIG